MGHLTHADNEPVSLRAVQAERREMFRRDYEAAANPIREVAVGFILIAIALIIALTILPALTSAVNTAQDDPNVSDTDGTLLGLLPTLLIVGLLAGGVAFLFRGFKQIRGGD